MEEQHLNPPVDVLVSTSTHMQQFALSASFLQRGALVVSFAVVLTSFLAWPYYPSLIYHAIQMLLFVTIIIIFFYSWRRVSSWRCLLTLGDKGAGTLLQGENGSLNKITLTKKPFISPLMCIIYLQHLQTGENRVLLVWSDMLDDTAYRNLCRLLLSH
ncbi:MAG: toxin CptA [Shewanella sp.]|uniref:protein YgfX n=1 Tax=unclassified Shewanella TaxID=196818 RepID=UPI00331F900D